MEASRALLSASTPTRQDCGIMLQRLRGFFQRPCAHHASGGTPWKGKQLPTKRAHSDVIQNFPIIILQIEAIGKNQEVQQKQIRNYTLTKFKPFLKILCRRKKKGKLTGHCRFSCFSGGGGGGQTLNCYSWLPKRVNWLVSLKILKSITCPSPVWYHRSWAPQLSPEWGRMEKDASWDIPATKRKADELIGASVEEEEGEEKVKVPRATDTCTRAVPLLTWIFIA